MIGFEGVVVVDVQGRSGGIALFWRRQDEVQLLSYSRNHIDVVVDIRGWSKFRMTGIYDEPDRIRRSETWNLIKGLKSQSMLPWCLIGDMNNVVKQEDKKGGHPYPSWLIQGFRDTLEECELEDVELTGYPYTWERGHEVKLTNLELSTSDHSPIFFELAKVVYSVNNKVFRFENAWLREPMCRQIMEEVWYRFQDRPMQEKIVECAEILQVWGKEITGSFKSRINQCKNIMRRAKGRRDNNSVKEYQEASNRLNEIYNQQEVFWRQRSKQLWLREGDQNSKYFHAATRNRRKINQIDSLLNDVGQRVG
ncbi:hypothetical protein AgCh_012418 [Apium graveolens]